MRVWLGALVLLAACHRAAPTARRDTGTDPSSVTDACGAIEATRVALDAGATVGYPVPLGAATSCARTASGAWGAVVDSVEPLYSARALPRIALHFTHAAATSLVAGPSETWSAIDRLQTFDFDGDGEAELIVEGKRGCAIDMDLMCDTPLAEVEVFTFTRGAVVPYRSPPLPPLLLQSHIVHEQANDGGMFFDRNDRALVFRSAGDVDGDGRPDLSSYLFYELVTTDGDVTTYFLHGPSFLAHSLPNGEFSLVDDVARRSLAASCEATEPFAKATGAGLFATAVCARLGGMGLDEITRRYVARCRPLLGTVRRGLADMVKGKEVDTSAFDWAAQGACRTEPEAAWSLVLGIPRSLVAMLHDTAPLLRRPPVAKP